MKTMMFISFCIALSGALLSYGVSEKRKGTGAPYTIEEGQYDGWALAGTVMLVISTAVWAAT